MNKIPFSLALATASLAAFSATLVSQPSSYSTTTNAANGGFYSDAFSTNGSQYYSQSEADNFTLSALSTVNSITFYGSSEYYQYSDLTNLASFQVQILNSSFTSVFNTTVSKASLSPTATGATNFAGGIEYAFTLSGLSQSLAAGTYYLNVGAIETDTTSDAFMFSVGTGGNSTHYFNNFGGGGYVASSSATDLAFSITGVQAVPEPAPLAALGLGVVAVLRRRARR